VPEPNLGALMAINAEEGSLHPLDQLVETMAG
jgi:hypothetical protein